MKKLEHKILPCVFCTIGLNCYVVGHNLVHAGVQLMNHKDQYLVNNDEAYSVSKRCRKTVSKNNHEKFV